MRLFVDNLTNLDFSYLHPQRGLVGETWLASIELAGELDEQGMVLDFGKVKKMLRHWLDEEIDHRLLVPSNAPELTLLETETQLKVDWAINKSSAHSHRIITESPKQAVTLVEETEITPESVAAWCINQFKNLFPSSVQEITLHFSIERIDGPFYHYSHGLKKHDGNCQRIAHGHRSKIEIWRNGQRDSALMQEWATRWQDIYIGTREDLAENGADYPEENMNFAYTSAQGSFRLSLPTQQCYLISSDSTVEFIAQHIATTLKDKHPQDQFTVKAYEGLNKGAIFSI